VLLIETLRFLLLLGAGFVGAALVCESGYVMYEHWPELKAQLKGDPMLGK
jgi:hypothetical protein